MSRKIDHLYKVQKKDTAKAGAVLADAFQHDPFWINVFEELQMDEKQMFFEGSIRYGLKYGNVYAPSENLEGIAVWVSNAYADMTMWRALRSGSIGFFLKMGMKTGKKMMSIFEPLEADRRENMKGRSYIYLIVIGIATEFQGKLFGGKLIEAVIEESERAGIPIYLETTTEKNIKMYERIGFTILSQSTLPVIHLPQWGMVREVKT